MTRSVTTCLTRGALIAGLGAALAACAVAPPRTDDPLQGFNRKMFAFNQTADKVAIRPVAKAYVKVTSQKERVLIGNFFANLRAPVTIVNEVLQGRPGPALQSTGRFVINSTVGFLGIFDPASDMRLPAHPTDFGVTLAQWGVPEGPYLVLPFVGPTTVRDIWRLPVDSYFDPLSWYSREHDLKWHAEYLPSAAYLVTLRASALSLDPILDSSYDPYAFMRDAYRQHRLYQVYFGNPPMSVMEQLQGTTPGEDSELDIDQLLQQQQQYEKAQGSNPAAPASSSSSGVAIPAPASSVPVPATSSGGPSSAQGR